MYTYGDSEWGDLLTAYDGKPITYDGIGNILTYDGWTYSWEHGRELASMSGGGTTWTYTYDANGMRTQRTNGTTTYTYVYNGSQLTQMTVGTTVYNFIYDASGRISMLQHGRNIYHYVTNIQGDVVAILDMDGDPVVNYTYDAWGNILSSSGSMDTTLGLHNPLRYRGYVYDQETQLYYLQSRYYNPNWGRFINADALVSTGQGILGNNMFAYCLNNPANCHDPSGMASFWTSTGDVNPLLSGYYGFGGGGGGGWDGSQYRDIIDAFTQKTNGLISYITNTDEKVVLAADAIAFYKGRVVVKAPIDNNAFSFGIIVIGDKISNTNVVQHEFGHCVHMSQIGASAYLTIAAIPSVIGFWTDVDYQVYYSQPWEYVADRFGGVIRNEGNYNYANWSDTVATVYWIVTLVVGGLSR